MELKKAIKCIDGTYVEGDAAHLADLAYRYNSDFSDENITEIQEFARAMKDERSDKLMGFLLESRRELRVGEMDLGQVKRDMYENTVTEAIQDIDDTRIEIWRDRDKVVLSIFGYDETGSWDATNAYDLQEFLDTKEGGLENLVRETIAYSKNYLEE